VMSNLFLIVRHGKKVRMSAGKVDHERIHMITSFCFFVWTIGVNNSISRAPRLIVHNSTKFIVIYSNSLQK